MSALSQFATDITLHLDQIDTAVDGVSTDVQSLSDLVAKLQSTQGQITPEDQALLDQIQSRTQSISAKVAALDALNPPPVPVQPVG